MNRSIRLGLVALALTLSATACASSRSAGPNTTSVGSQQPPVTAAPSTASPTTPATTTPATTTAATTTVPATATPTTAAATTTTPFDTLELQIGGIGPYPHGMSITKVLPGLQAVLGAPSTDEAREYPTLDGSGGYLTAQGDLGYGTPHGREVCWAFGFCAEFGGPTVDELTLTGWTYGGDTHHTLHSRSGVSIGTRWSDVPAMDVQSGGCHTQGDGTVDGIVLQLESSGLPFGGTDTAGSYLPNLPDPKDVTVLTMKSGDVPMFLFTDC